MFILFNLNLIIYYHITNLMMDYFMFLNLFKILYMTINYINIIILNLFYLILHVIILKLKNKVNVILYNTHIYLLTFFHLNVLHYQDINNKILNNLCLFINYIKFYIII